VPTVTLEQRVEALEKEVAALKEQISKLPEKKQKRKIKILFNHRVKP
jgi:chaperonin cofactor prefoldin